MTKIGKKLYFATCILAGQILLTTGTAQAMSANDQASYIPFTGFFGYGSNMGYYGEHLKDQDVAQLAYNSGSRTIRPSLPDWLITGYGVDARRDAFKAYQQMGMRDLAAFVGEPNDPAVNGTSGPDNRETKKFPGADERAKTFKGLYEPVWLDSGKTQINPANTYATYLYKTVKEYGPYVKYWEIVNEPDFTYTSAGWEDASESDSWWKVNPNPQDLTNLKAPIFYYIRELRVAYDVIKTVDPSDYVATGGIGYASFLDALMRNTDNPVDGSVTAEYPLKGGAYFDVLSFHSYPMYSLKEWSTVINNFVYRRHSDAAVDTFIGTKTDFEAVLSKYGYMGSPYPKKQWIVTETDMPQKTIGDDYGSPALANNYIVKADIMAQANGINAIYKYGFAENESTTDIFNTMGVYGDITRPSTTIANAPKTEQFKAVLTVSNLLYGKTFDQAQTLALNLPSNVRGAALRDSNGAYTYVLWARTTIDKSEDSSATYTFPFSFSGTRREIDFSASNASTTAGQTITLSGAPSFFTSGAGAVIPPYIPPYVPPTYPPYVPPYQYSNSAPRANAGADKLVTLTTGTTTAALLSGNGTDIDGTVSQYRWNQISGPNTASIATQNSATSIAAGLVRGTYSFRLTVTDNSGMQGTDDVVITVIGSGRVYVSAAILNVRKTANGVLKNRVYAGTQGLITDQVTLASGVWNKVQFDNGISGWVAGRYLIVR